MTGSLAIDPHLPELQAEIGRYYTQKVIRHGPTPLGVDWPCQPTQELRFVQLLRLCDFSAPFSLNDVGCGYGALLGFVGKRHPRHQIDYVGTDLSAAMIEEATRMWRKRRPSSFVVADGCSRSADYAVASGIFNVKLDQADAPWIRHIETVLADMYAHGRRGFATNFLAPLPEGQEGVPQLYRAPAGIWQTYCEERLGARVEVLANYGMREYTLLVTRPPA